MPKAIRLQVITVTARAEHESGTYGWQYGVNMLPVIFIIDVTTSMAW